MQPCIFNIHRAACAPDKCNSVAFRVAAGSLRATDMEHNMLCDSNGKKK